MTKYAPEKKELAPRDLISRSIVTEIMERRGFKGPNGLDYVLLDFSPIGAERVKERLPMMIELGHSFVGIDPLEAPLPIRPVAHYSMGGIHVNIKGETAVRGLWAAGECACVSVHGGNRLGANSTTACMVYGRITGEEAAKYIMNGAPAAELPRARVEAEEKRIFNDLLGREHGEDPYTIKKELLSTMDQNMYVFRNEAGMTTALKKVRELKARYHNVRVVDKSSKFNTNLTGTLEVGNLLDVAEAVVVCGLMRKESRGAHSRKDFLKRDDINFLKHSLAYYTPEGPMVEYQPVVITRWAPAERKY